MNMIIDDEIVRWLDLSDRVRWWCAQPSGSVQMMNPCADPIRKGLSIYCWWLLLHCPPSVQWEELLASSSNRELVK